MSGHTKGPWSLFNQNRVLAVLKKRGDWPLDIRSRLGAESGDGNDRQRCGSRRGALVGGL